MLRVTTITESDTSRGARAGDLLCGTQEFESLGVSTPFSALDQFLRYLRDVTVYFGGLEACKGRGGGVQTAGKTQEGCKSACRPGWWLQEDAWLHGMSLTASASNSSWVLMYPYVSDYCMLLGSYFVCYNLQGSNGSWLEMKPGFQDIWLSIPAIASHVCMLTFIVNCNIFVCYNLWSDASLCMISVVHIYTVCIVHSVLPCQQEVMLYSCHCQGLTTVNWISFCICLPMRGFSLSWSLFGARIAILLSFVSNA